MTRNHRLAQLLLAALFAAACSGPAEAPQAATTAEEPGPASTGDAVALEAFFDPEAVHRIDITVSESGVASLLAAPKEYVTGSVSIDGTILHGVGVKLKGNATFVPLRGEWSQIGVNNGMPGKSPFVIDFNRFAAGQDYLGLGKVSLNNMAQDPSCVHETLGYALFREVGVPASRTSYATVTFNGQPKGLYLLVENADNEALLRRWFGTDQANLYEGEIPNDFFADQVAGFDQDHGEDESKDDLRALVAALDAIGPEQDPMPVLEAIFDMDEYLSFAATEIYLNHWDGYVGGHPNNYFVFHAEAGWSFLPWGLDTALELPEHSPPHLARHAGVMKAAGPRWSDRPRVHALCFRSAMCLKRLHDAIEDVIEVAGAMDLAGLAKDVRAVAEPLALAESTAYGNPELTKGSLDAVDAFLTARKAQLETWLVCLDGGTVDADGDGLNGCTTDCDDADAGAGAGPGGLCQLEPGGQAGPGGCLETASPEGRLYVFCEEPLTWQEARARCQDMGRDLASIHDQATLDHMLSELAGVFTAKAEIRAWVGLNDRNDEGDFQWTDGSAVDFLSWSEGSPSTEDAEARDCVRISAAGFGDRPCEVLYPFMCL